MSIQPKLSVDRKLKGKLFIDVLSDEHRTTTAKVICGLPTFTLMQ